MKKTTKRLTLNRETLLALSDLHTVAGATAVYSDRTVCHTGCVTNCPAICNRVSNACA